MSISNMLHHCSTIISSEVAVYDFAEFRRFEVIMIQDILI